MGYGGKYLVGKFPQRIPHFYTEKNGLVSDTILSLAFDNKNNLVVGTDKGLCIYKDGAFKKKSLKGTKEYAVHLMFRATDGTLFIASENILFSFKDNKVVSSQELNEKIVAIDEDGEKNLWLTTRKSLYQFSDGEFKFYSDINDEKAECMTAIGNARIYISDEDYLLGLHGKRPRWSRIDPDVSNIPEGRINAITSDPWGNIWVSSENGAYIYDAEHNWYTSEKIVALPKDNVKKIVFGKNGARYYITDIGLIIQDGTAKSYLTGDRWFLSDNITDVAVSDDADNIWVATDNGLSLIEVKMMTLEEKAQHYQETVEKYHNRENFVTIRNLSVAGDISSGSVEISDNDGLWTSFYVTSQALKYAVTKDKKALECAKKSFKALMKLLTISGVPGFPARACRRPGELGFGDGDIEWHLTEDEIGPLEWKGETSSDEIVGEFFCLTYYYDLCADKKEKEEIINIIRSIVDHIIKNDYTLCDCDGLATTWSHWAPNDLNLSDIWFWEKGICSFELLCMLKVAHKLTGDEKYINEYKKLVTEHHYAINCMQYKIDDDYDNHIDDSLGFITAATIFRYEDDPFMRQYFLSAMRHHWDIERLERTPLWNIIYGAFSGDTCDIEKAVRSMQELPLDLIQYRTLNGKRKDLKWVMDKNGKRKRLCEPLPYDEKPILKYDAPPFIADRGCGKKAEDGTVFLLPYWFARYFGLIDEM